MARAAETPGKIGTNPTIVNREEIPFLQRIQRGLVAGHVPFEIMSRSSAPLTTTFTDVSAYPVNLPATPEAMDVRSTSVNDTSGTGTGARDIIIFGLPADKSQVVSTFQPPYQSELVLLDGTNLVRTANVYSAIVGSRLQNRGSLGTNEGEIIVQRSSDAVEQHSMPPGRSRGQQDSISVPSNYAAMVIEVTITWDGTDAIEWRLRQDTGSGRRDTIADGDVVTDSNARFVFPEGKKIIEGATAWFQARRTAGAPAATVTINAAGYLYMTNDGGAPDTLPGG